MITIFPMSISRRFLKGWQRNFIVYRKVWVTNALPNMLLPFFFVVSFGMGLNALVGKFFYYGSEVSYIHFVAPAIIATNIMFNAFFESTYSSFVRMDHQKTFDAMMATPLNMTEIVTGEIIWGATKALIAAAIMQAIVTLFGFIQYPVGLLILPLAFLGGIAFSSIGMFFTGTVSTLETFNLPICLFITPMSVICDTFFPVQNMSTWVQWLVAILPLTHLVRLTRAFSFGVIDAELLWSCAYLVVFCVVFFLLAVYKIHHRLMK